MDILKEAIGQIVKGKDLSSSMMADVMDAIMEGKATQAQIGALLVGLRMKGETPQEIGQAARVMRDKAIRIKPRLSEGEPLVDTCGTGGDGTNTFNISTTSAFVVAGAGIKVAKHGNRSVSSRSGSADLLEALGINISLSKEDVKRAIEEVGIGFLFAPNLHPAMKNVIGPRRELGIRTIFNCLGPLTNPAGANCQVLGVFSKDLVGVLARVLSILGIKRAWVVHGLDGMDEISPCEKSLVAEVIDGKIREFEFDPRKYGFTLCQPEEIKGKDPEENAKITLDILEGKDFGPKRDAVLLNSSAAILVSGRAKDFNEALELSRRSIDEKRALKKLNELREFSNRCTS